MKDQKRPIIEARTTVGLFFCTENRKGRRPKLNLHLKWDSLVCIESFERTFFCFFSYLQGRCWKFPAYRHFCIVPEETTSSLVLGRYCWHCWCCVVCVFCPSPDWFHVQPFTDLQEQHTWTEKRVLSEWGLNLTSKSFISNEQVDVFCGCKSHC